MLAPGQINFKKRTCFARRCLTNFIKTTFAGNSCQIKLITPAWHLPPGFAYFTVRFCRPLSPAPAASSALLGQATVFKSSQLWAQHSFSHFNMSFSIILNQLMSTQVNLRKLKSTIILFDSPGTPATNL